MKRFTSLVSARPLQIARCAACSNTRCIFKEGPGTMLAALIIVFRETIEAGLVVGIVLAATRGIAGRGNWVGYGIGGGILGACLVAAFARSISAAFAGMGQEIFDA